MMTNGHSGGVSPDSSQLSDQVRHTGESTLVTRTQKQHVTHNVTTTTKTIREVQYIGPDGQPLDFMPGEHEAAGSAYHDYNGSQAGPMLGDYQNYQMYSQMAALSGQPGQYNRPPTPPTPSERSTSPLTSHRVPGKLLCFRLQVPKVHHFKSCIMLRFDGFHVLQVAMLQVFPSQTQKIVSNNWSSCFSTNRSYRPTCLKEGFLRNLFKKI